MAALLHDVGKSITTVFKHGHIVSPGHDTMGVPLAEDFLRSIGFPFAKDGPSPLTQKVLRLIECHMRHINPVTRKSALRLSRDVHPANIRLLTLLMEADHSARPPFEEGIPKNAKKLTGVRTGDEIRQRTRGKHLMWPRPDLTRHAAWPRDGRTAEACSRGSTQRGILRF